MFKRMGLISLLGIFIIPLSLQAANTFIHHTHCEQLKSQVNQLSRIQKNFDCWDKLAGAASLTGLACYYLQNDEKIMARQTLKFIISELKYALVFRCHKPNKISRVMKRMQCYRKSIPTNEKHGKE